MKTPTSSNQFFLNQIYDLGKEKYSQRGEEREKDKILLSPIINGLSIEEKETIKELFSDFNIEDILENKITSKYIEVMRKIKSICSKNIIKLYRFRDIFFEILDGEEKRKKELAGDYYREDIKENVRDIL